MKLVFLDLFVVAFRKLEEREKEQSKHYLVCVQYDSSLARSVRESDGKPIGSHL